MNPNFGTLLRRFLFEGITDNNIESLRESISNSIAIYIPEIIVLEIIVSPNTDYNSIELNVNYVLKISNTPDQVTVQFQ